MTSVIRAAVTRETEKIQTCNSEQALRTYACVCAYFLAQLLMGPAAPVTKAKDRRDPVDVEGWGKQDRANSEQQNRTTNAAVRTPIYHRTGRPQVHRWQIR